MWLWLRNWSIACWMLPATLLSLHDQERLYLQQIWCLKHHISTSQYRKNVIKSNFTQVYSLTWSLILHNCIFLSLSFVLYCRDLLTCQYWTHGRTYEPSSIHIIIVHVHVSRCSISIEHLIHLPPSTGVLRVIQQTIHTLTETLRIQEDNKLCSFIYRNLWPLGQRTTDQEVWGSISNAVNLQPWPEPWVSS